MGPRSGSCFFVWLTESCVSMETFSKTMLKEKSRFCSQTAIVTAAVVIVVCFLFLGTLLCINAKEKNLSQEGRFEDEIRRYELLSKDAPPTSENTIFIGSSNFAWWGSDLEKRFEQFQAVNRGFGGAHTTDLLSALPRLVLPYKPNRIVVFIGGNDIAYYTEPENVFENFKQILGQIWTANPKTEVFFVSPTHAPIRKKYWQQMDRYDQKVFDLSQRLDGLYHIDITNPMNDAHGKVRENLYLTDGLHLNKMGRDLWGHLIASAIENSLENPVTTTDEQLRLQREENGIFQRDTEAGVEREKR